MEEIKIKCGKVQDGFDVLTTLCEKEAQKLCSQLNLQPNTTIEIPFWTKDIPELIGIGKFTADEKKKVTFVLDYSQTTL